VDSNNKWARTIQVASSRVLNLKDVFTVTSLV
jgi:hypothetical protein